MIGPSAEGRPSPGPDPAVARALGRGGLVDLTTTGRRTGLARTVEIVFHVIDGRIFVSGTPRPERRSWLANLAADPRLTFQLKESAGRGQPGTPIGPPLAGRARIIDAGSERRAVLAHVAATWGRSDLETMVAWSPLIEVVLE